MPNRARKWKQDLKHLEGYNYSLTLNEIGLKPRIHRGCKEDFSNLVLFTLVHF